MFLRKEASTTEYSVPTIDRARSSRLRRVVSLVRYGAQPDGYRCIISYKVPIEHNLAPSYHKTWRAPDISPMMESAIGPALLVVPRSQTGGDGPEALVHHIKDITTGEDLRRRP